MGIISGAGEKGGALELEELAEGGEGMAVMYFVISGDFLCHSEIMERYSMKESPVWLSVGRIRGSMDEVSSPAIVASAS